MDLRMVGFTFGRIMCRLWLDKLWCTFVSNFAALAICFRRSLDSSEGCEKSLSRGIARAEIAAPSSSWVRPKKASCLRTLSSIVDCISTLSLGAANNLQLPTIGYISIIFFFSSRSIPDFRKSSHLDAISIWISSA